MSRRTAAPVRHILPDPKFNNDMLAKFMNVVMQSGKKSAAERIIYGAINRIVEKTGKPGPDAVAMLTTALDNVKPVVEVKSRRVGGATYQVPVEVRAQRRQTLAMRWLIEAARERSEKSMAFRLAHELMDAAENRGAAVRKREDTHRMAEANKASRAAGSRTTPWRDSSRKRTATTPSRRLALTTTIRVLASSWNGRSASRAKSCARTPAS